MVLIVFLSRIKKQGVIGTVQLINHIIRTEDIGSAESIYDLDASYDTVEQLPDGRAKIAANYIGMLWIAVQIQFLLVSDLVIRANICDYSILSRYLGTVLWRNGSYLFSL